MNISRLYECIKKKNINQSSAREAIYITLMRADNCMSIGDIMQKVEDIYPKKISLNTVYRHLTLFIECELVVVIQDNYKKAYYYKIDECANAFSLCPKCNLLTVMKESFLLENTLKGLENNEFLTIHKRCSRCKKI